MESPRRLPAVSAQVPESILTRRSSSSLIPENGPTSLQKQVDQLTESFIAEASDWKSLAALTAGGLAYRWGKMGVMGSKLGHVAAIPLRALSIVAGLGSEVTAFELTNRILQSVEAQFGRPGGETPPLQHQSPNLWSWSGSNGWKQSLLADLVTFGMLKGAGHLSREANIVFQHAFSSSAMVTGHQVSGFFGITPLAEGTLPEQLLHAETTNLQLGAGTSLTHSMAPGILALERGMDFSLQSPVGRANRPSSLQNQWGPMVFQSATAESPSRIAPHSSPDKSHVIMMSSSDDPKSGRKNDNTGRYRHPTLPPIPPPDLSGPGRVIGLVDLPNINEALLHQVRQVIIRAPDLSELMRSYGSNLRKLDRAMGNDPKGAAPFVSRFLADAILSDPAVEVDLPHHPIALMVAASLAAHYEATGDLIGNRVFRDLNRVYVLLSQDRQKNILEVEKIILQNLERDPFNPWLIHLGLSVSRELAQDKIAIKDPLHYENLLETMRRLPETWNRSAAGRALEEKVVGKFRKNFLKAAWQTSGWYGFAMGILEPAAAFLTGFVPRPANIIRWVNRLFKAGKGVQNAPSLLEAYKRKTSFEINLYYGDYRGALPFAEPTSSLPRLWELLEAQQKGERIEEEIELEEIPKLNPQAVKQNEAIRELEEKLSHSPVVTLEGIAGSAKTYLAVQFANKYKNKPDRLVFWYTFLEGKKPDLRRALEHLAFFLESKEPQSEEGLFAKVRDKNSIEGQINLLGSALVRTQTYLFFDNFHLVLDDPDAAALIRKLVPKGIGESKVITIIRRSEEWLHSIGAQIFRHEEMGIAEARQLFKNIGVHHKFGPSQLEEIYQLTRGRPMALALVGELVRCGKDETLTRLIEVFKTLENRAQVLKFLFEEVYKTLPYEQQFILQYLSIFREPVPKEAMVFLGQTEDERLKGHLIHLEEAFLLEERHPGLFELHERYKNLAAFHLEDSPELHRRAAEFYRTYSKYPRDFLEAAHHYFEAGEYDRSIKMISKWIPLLLKRGYQERVQELLNRLGETTRLRREDRVLLNMALGEVAVFQNDWAQALEYSKKAVILLRKLDGEKHLPLAYTRMANAYLHLEDGPKALKYFEKSLSLLKKLEDRRGMNETYHSMAMIYQSQGQWDKAEALFKDSLSLAEELGDRKGMANTFYNLGLLERDRKQIAQAIHYLRQSLEMHRELKTPNLDYLETLLNSLEKS